MRRPEGELIGHWRCAVTLISAAHNFRANIPRVSRLQEALSLMCADPHWATRTGDGWAATTTPAGPPLKQPLSPAPSEHEMEKV